MSSRLLAVKVLPLLWKAESPHYNETYLYSVAGWVLQSNEFLSIVLQLVHLALVGQQAVVLEVLNEVKAVRLLSTAEITPFESFKHKQPLQSI